MPGCYSAGASSSSDQAQTRLLLASLWFVPSLAAHLCLHAVVISPWSLGGLSAMISDQIADHNADGSRDMAGPNVLRPGPGGLGTGNPLNECAMASIRRQAVLEGCKWDPQVGDVSTLAAFPLIMRGSVWSNLARYAEQLAAEAFSAEVE